MRIVLHIGQSKTGTSAIQEFLTLNRSFLQTKGVLYPAARIRGIPIDMGAHNAVADSLAGLSRFPHLEADEYFAQFFGEASRIQARLLILSGEHFFGGEPRIWNVGSENEYFELYRKKIDKLATYLKGHDIHLLVYLRPQLDWLGTAASHTIRVSRLISSIQIYQDDRQFFDLMNPLLKYATLLDAWTEYLKPSTFTVVPYVKSGLQNGSSISDFLYRTGLEKLQCPYASTDIQVNTSLTREYVEVKKILNRSSCSKQTERVTIRCLERLSEKSREGTGYHFSEDIRRDLEALVAPENARLNQQFGTEQQSFVAASSTQNRECRVLGKDDVLRAKEAFEREYRHPRYKLLMLNYAVRAFLRTHGKPVQAVLHRAKMYYLKIKSRNRLPLEVKS